MTHLVATDNGHHRRHKAQPTVFRIAAPEFSNPAATELSPNRQWIAYSIASFSVPTPPYYFYPLLNLGALNKVLYKTLTNIRHNL